MEMPEAYESLIEAGNELATRRVVPLVVNPLAQAIASRP